MPETSERSLETCNAGRAGARLYHVLWRIAFPIDMLRRIAGECVPRR